MGRDQNWGSISVNYFEREIAVLRGKHKAAANIALPKARVKSLMVALFILFSLVFADK